LKPQAIPIEAYLHHLATGVGRSIRSPDAPQAIKKDDEDENPAISPRI
jgi:hypothetical protein